MLNMCSVAVEPKGRAALVEHAMRLFGERGVAPTSLREVAKSAGVSPALVVHHFGGKDGLVAAVDEAALLAFGDAYASEPAVGVDLLRLRSEQTSKVMSQRPEACAYIGRALVEGTPGARRLFRTMIAGGGAEIDALAERGALREDVDRLWATLQHFFLIWAPLGFRHLLEEEALDGDLLEGRNLDRWVEANVRLLGGGVYADG
jgi:AcrR family transcriptional regulator